MSEVLHPGWFAAYAAPTSGVVVVASGPAPDVPAGEHLSLDVTPVTLGTESDGRASLARRAVVACRALVDARGAPGVARTVYRLKRSASLRAALAHADVVLAADATVDAALRRSPAALRGIPWIPSTDLPRVVATVAALDEWAERLQAAVDDPSGGDLTEVDLATPALDAPPGLPTAHLVADLTRRLAGASRPLAARAARAVSRGLDLPADEVARSGLPAQLGAAELMLVEHPETLDEDDLSRRVRVTLAAADAALAAGRGSRALGLLADAMALLFHRERHADAASSRLVDDPDTFLHDLVRSATFQRVTSGGRGPQHRPEDRTGGDGVAVVTGAYNAFHAEVVAALRDPGGVDAEVVDLAQRPFFRTTTMTTDALAGIVVARRGHLPPGVPQPGRMRVTERRLLQRLRDLGEGRRAVFSDWADKSTAFLSHTLPLDVRLTMRVHRVDAFDPWFFLVDWSRIAEVIVVSPAFKELVEALVGALGHTVAVRVVPSFGSVEGLARPKPDSARTTLGLIGWSRRPKDPLWALDVLERCPGYTLVLVGTASQPSPSVAGRHYGEELACRLEALADRVEVVGWTDDVPGLLERVGVVLSSSRSEGCHRGLIEGSASGAVAVVRDWPLIASRGGPHGLVPDSWVVGTVDEAVARVLEVTAPERWRAESAATAERAAVLFDGGAADQRYVEVVLGERT